MDLSRDMMVKDDHPFPFQKEVLKKEPSEDDTILALSRAAEALPSPDAAPETDSGDEPPTAGEAAVDEPPTDSSAEAPLETLPAAPPLETRPAEAGEDEDDDILELSEKDEVPVAVDSEEIAAAPAAPPPVKAKAEAGPAEPQGAAPPPVKPRESMVEPPPATDDDGEEIDLSEAEEMSSAPPAVPAASKEGRKPRIRRRKKRSTEWWSRIFNDDYVSTIPKATVRGDQRKVNFIEKSLSLPPNSLVLDLACGNGRHSVGMAKRGYRVVGIDLSLPMLAQAAELAQDENQNINFIHGDMRDLSFDRTFDGIFCMGTSFGYFDEESNLEVLKGVVRSLKPGGSFLLEVANRDHVITQTPDLTWFEGNGSVCMEETQFEFKTSRLEVNRQLIMDGGRQVQNKVSIRLYCLHELCEMFEEAGLTIGSISGHGATQDAFFGKDSVRILITAKRGQ